MNDFIHTFERNDPWFVRRLNPKARVRLFCFPFAGGGASIYRDWSQKLPEEIEVWAIQYPGRENRISEPPIDSLNIIVAKLFNKILPYLNVPYAFFGHSLGAKIAFETAKKLSIDEGLHPVCLFVSGSRAPHLEARLKMHELNETDFINSLRWYAGTPEAVLQDRELMDLFLPMLRADFILDGKFTSDPDEKADFPIYAFAGDNDVIAPVDEVKEWSRFTNGCFEMQVFNGDHFFFRRVQPLMFEPMIRVLHSI